MTTEKPTRLVPVLDLVPGDIYRPDPTFDWRCVVRVGVFRMPASGGGYLDRIRVDVLGCRPARFFKVGTEVEVQCGD